MEFLRVAKKGNEDVLITVFKKDKVYKVFCEDVLIFECAKNKTLLDTLINAYKKLLEK